jgi:hypothetical protein
MNTFKITINNVVNVESGRKWALRRCAWCARALYDEFHKFAGDIVDPKDLAEKAEAFAREKGLRVINEKPSACVYRDHYVVDVEYTIAW